MRKDDQWRESGGALMEGRDVFDVPVVQSVLSPIRCGRRNLKYYSDTGMVNG